MSQGRVGGIASRAKALVDRGHCRSAGGGDRVDNGDVADDAFPACVADARRACPHRGQWVGGRRGVAEKRCRTQQRQSCQPGKKQPEMVAPCRTDWLRCPAPGRGHRGSGGHDGPVDSIDGHRHTLPLECPSLRRDEVDRGRTFGTLPFRPLWAPPGRRREDGISLSLDPSLPVWIRPCSGEAATVGYDLQKSSSLANKAARPRTSFSVRPRS
jgi:hypothetical protein